jgi:hypothetical protein
LQSSVIVEAVYEYQLELLQYWNFTDVTDSNASFLAIYPKIQNQIAHGAFVAVFEHTTHEINIIMSCSGCNPCGL